MRQTSVDGQQAERLLQTRVEFLPLLLALIIASFIAFISLRTWRVYDDQLAAFRRSRDVVAHSLALLSSVKDAETGQRGYLLTRRHAYLTPYSNSLSKVNVELASLSRSIAEAERGGVETNVDLHDLKSTVEGKTAELEQTVKLCQSGDMPQALQIVQSDRGQILMDKIRAQLAAVIEQHQKLQAQLPHELSDSRSRLAWVGVGGSLLLTALLAVAQVTLRRAAHKRYQLISELSASRQQTATARDLLEVTLVSIGDAVISTDAGGRVTFINPVGQRLTGWTQESALGVPLYRVFRIINETTRETVENPVDKVIRTGQIVGLANHTILLSADGREVPIDDSAAPIRKPNGEIAGTVLVFRDVSQRRRSEIELQHGRQKLEQSNAELQQLNADLELFARAAGHDLQEPLRTIAAFSELIARKLRDNPDTLEHIRFVQGAVARIQRLIEGLLNYSRLSRESSLDREPVQMDEVVGEVLLNCQTAIAESNAVIQTSTMPVVKANRPQMIQLFQNLILNSIKYRDQRAPEIRISSAPNEADGSFEFSVRDNGIGFSMDYADEIFGVFRRLHNRDRYDGTGLGLAVCKRIVELHGGVIWAESRPGEGATFRFTVPKAIPDSNGKRHTG